MIIADAKFLDSKGAAKFVTPTTTNLMRRLSFLRKPTATAAPVTPPPASPPPAARVASPPPAAQAPRPAAPAPRPAAPPAGAARPGAPAAPARARARPAAPAAQRPAAPQAKAPAAPARPAVPAKAPVAPPKAAQPAARPAAPPARPAAPAAKPARAAAPEQLRDTDSIAFEISDIDPRSLLKGAQRAAQPEAKRPDLRVVQTDRLPKLELKLEADPIPELIQDEPPAAGDRSRADVRGRRQRRRSDHRSRSAG